MISKLFLIDGSSYFFRAYYAFSGLTNSEGLPTNAVLGFTNMLNKVLNEHKPNYLAVIFDPKGPTFRKEIYEGYKANRGEMPDDLAVQIPYIKDLVRAERMASLEMPGYEADDLIATLVKRFSQKPDLEITIVSGDKDLLQLVTDNVTMLDTMRDIRFGIAEVKEKYGVSPHNLLDVFALAGDSSDNIPGIPGFGLKTATGLIQEYGTLENLFEHADEVKGKSKVEKLKAHVDLAKLSKRLVTLREDVPIECDLGALERQEPDFETLEHLYRKLEFKQHLAKLHAQSQGSLGLAVEPTTGFDHQRYRLLTELPEIEIFLEKIRAQCIPFAVDLETTSKIPMEAKIVGCSLCVVKGQAVYIPLGHQGSDVRQPPIDAVFALLKPVLEDARIGKKGQNLKYDDVVFRNHGIALQGIAFDSMLASYLLEAEQRSEHNLTSLCKKYLQSEKQTFEQVTQESLDFKSVPPAMALRYSGEDVDAVVQLEEKMLPLLNKMDLLALFSQVELPLSSVLAKMEFYGVAVDCEQLQALSKRYESEMQKLTAEIYRLAGGEFLISSPKQLQVILFEKLNLPKGRKTKTGFSTDTDVLQTLAMIHDLPAFILRYRMLAKLQSTYVEALPTLIHPKTGRIHTQYQQAVAATGRLSSANPNLQNIPIRGEEGQHIRAAFVPGENFLLLGADYSQVELRLFAHFSEDETLVSAYRDGLDIHDITAQAIFNCELDQVTADMRRRAKTVNFGILYGMSDFGLAKQLGIARPEAADFIERYFKRYPGVRNYLDRTIAQAHQQGFVSTYLGRRRALAGLKSKNFNERKGAERAAASTTIQGSAADLIKVAMLRVEQGLQKMQAKSRLIMQVHDELVLEVAPSESEAVRALVKEAMELVWTLRVPIQVDTNMGKNWLEAH